jgi:hypothetical protein
MAERAVSDETPVASAAGTPAEPVRWWISAAALLRWLLGALSLVGGLTWILFTAHGPTAGVDLAVGLVLAGAGLVLLMPHRIRLPRRVTALVMTVSALAGTVGGLAAVRSQECCSFAFVVDRGWPFAWARRGAVADDPETAFRLAQSARWSADLVSVAADLLLWAYAGMLLVVIGVLVRRAVRERRG